MSSDVVTAGPPSTGITLRAALAFLAAFALCTGALMMLNTIVFGFGDPKFGRSGWTLYWPLWVGFYSPAALLFAVQSSRIPSERTALASFFIPSLVLLLFTLEASFVLDSQWPWLLAEFVALAAVSEFLVQLRRRRALHNKAMKSDVE